MGEKVYIATGFVLTGRLEAKHIVSALELFAKTIGVEVCMKSVSYGPFRSFLTMRSEGSKGDMQNVKDCFDRLARR